MNRALSTLSLSWLLTLLLSVSCAFEDHHDEDHPFVVLPGKEDNFFSLGGREYVVEGVTTVELEPEYRYADEDVRMQRVRELVPLQQVVVSWFLNAYLRDKSESERHYDYGGFNTLVKNGSYEDLEITHLEGETYEFRFRQEVGGQMDLLSVLPTTLGEDGRHRFDLIVGRISNEDMAKLEPRDEWYRSSPWSQFNPDNVSAERLDTVPLTIWPQPRSSNAWMDYNRLFEDGELRMAVHLGWDWMDWHLRDARDIYRLLTNTYGFRSPVRNFADYRHDSGPLTRTIFSNGRPVEVKIWLRWGQYGTATDPDTVEGSRLLVDLMKHDLGTADVIIYKGHSSPTSGFLLGNWRVTSEAVLAPAHIPHVEMPKEYQVVIAAGCLTYDVGQAFRMNPAKSDLTNLDVITTSAITPYILSTLEKFIVSVIGISRTSRNHLARSYSQILQWVDWSVDEPMGYGVHGIDSSPRLHPYADLDKICDSCRADSECGGQGNHCVALLDGERVCAPECTADDGCPLGYVCAHVARASWHTSKACIPATYSCENPMHPEDDPRGKIIINEIGVDPTDGPDGDWNRDGVRDASEDQFVELYNTSDSPMRLGGWTISDRVGDRFTFPDGAAIPAHGAVLVFGGGEPPVGAFRGVQFFVSDRTLALNTGGDTVTLANARGGAIDQVIYGPEGGQGVSLVRETDGDGESSLIPHPGPYSASPGTRTDGTSF